MPQCSGAEFQNRTIWSEPSAEFEERLSEAMKAHARAARQIAKSPAELKERIKIHCAESSVHAPP